MAPSLAICRAETRDRRRWRQRCSPHALACLLFRPARPSSRRRRCATTRRRASWSMSATAGASRSTAGAQARPPSCSSRAATCWARWLEAGDGRRSRPKSRACAYSRAGILWSDPARGAFEPQEVARDLHAALQAAGEKPALSAGLAFARRALQHDLRRPLQRRDRGHGASRTPRTPTRRRAFAKRVCRSATMSRPSQEFGAGLPLDRPDAAVALSGRSLDRGRRERLLSEIRRGQCARGARSARRRWRRRASIATCRTGPSSCWRANCPNRRRRASAPTRMTPTCFPPMASLPDRTRPRAKWCGAGCRRTSRHGRAAAGCEIVPESNHAFFFHRPDVVAAAIDEVLAASRVVRRAAASGGTSGSVPSRQ